MSSLLELSGDLTSSGASRLYNASLVFQKGQIASGWQRYEVWPSSPSYPRTIYECIIDINFSSWEGEGNWWRMRDRSSKSQPAFNTFNQI